MYVLKIKSEFHVCIVSPGNFYPIYYYLPEKFPE